MFVIFALAVKNQGLSPHLVTDGHVANSPACRTKSPVSSDPACSDAASTPHWRMSNVSSSQTREASSRVRLDMGHDCSFAEAWASGAGATVCWRLFDCERDHAWNSRS